MPDVAIDNSSRPGRLGDICRVNPEKRDSGWPHDEIEYIDISSVGTGVITTPPAKMPTAEAPSRAQRLVRPGDTILATVRPNLRSFAYPPDLAEGATQLVLRQAELSTENSE